MSDKPISFFVRNHIADILTQKGVGLEYLQENLGIKYQTAYSWVTRNNPRYRMALKISELLGVPLSELFYLDFNVFESPVDSQATTSKTNQEREDLPATPTAPANDTVIQTGTPEGQEPAPEAVVQVQPEATDGRIESDLLPTGGYDRDTSNEAVNDSLIPVNADSVRIDPPDAGVQPQENL
jgi:hypothetical protein